MRVCNVHEREMVGSIEQAAELIRTQSTQNDRMWPGKNWPKMQLEGPEGPPAVGRVGGHGLPRFIFTTYERSDTSLRLSWKFIRPENFDGGHMTAFEKTGPNKVLFRSVMEMETRGVAATLLWLMVARPLHDALVKDCIDKVEWELSKVRKETQWSMWVRFLRKIRSRNQPQH